MKRILLLSVYLGITEVFSFEKTKLPKITTLNQYFIDDNSSYVFHGFNVVVKIPPYLPTDGDFDHLMSLNERDIDNMYMSGTNIVRLGVIWEAVEK